MKKWEWDFQNDHILPCLHCKLTSHDIWLLEQNIKLQLCDTFGGMKHLLRYLKLMLQLTFACKGTYPNSQNCGFCCECKHFLNSVMHIFSNIMRSLTFLYNLQTCWFKIMNMCNPLNAIILL